MGYLLALIIGVVGFFLLKKLYTVRNGLEPSQTLAINLLAYAGLTVTFGGAFLAMFLSKIWTELDRGILGIVATVPMAFAMRYRKRSPKKEQ